MTPRPPSELSAALRQLGEPMKARDVETAALLASSVEVFPGPIAREAADLIDRLTRELSEARLALIALEVDKAAAEKMAIETGRELAEARKALKKAPQERLAPVQGYSAGIPWAMHLRAYDAYCKRYGRQEALIDLEGRNCRGGFHTDELDEFIPGWRDELSELTKLRAALEKAEGGLVTLDVAFTASEGARVAVATERDQAMRERDLLRTCGIIEVAIRNPNVASYCEHWEGRTEKAEASCREHAEAIVALRNEITRWLDWWAAWAKEQQNLDKLKVYEAMAADIRIAAAKPLPALASRLSAERREVEQGKRNER